MVNLLKDIDNIVIDTTDKQDDIEALLEVLGLLRIIKEYTSEENRTTELAIPEIEEMLIVLVPVVYNGIEQVVMPKSIVSDSGQFDGDQIKFEDWWRGI